MVCLPCSLNVLHSRFKAAVIRTLGFQKTLESLELARILAKCRPVSTIDRIVNPHVYQTMEPAKGFANFAHQFSKYPWKGRYVLCMDSFFENAQRIFDVARSGAVSPDSNGEDRDFALLIRPDGGLHFVMESPFSLEAAAIHGGASIAYRVSTSRDGVRVQGRSGGKDCVIEERNPAKQLLRDQPLYRISSPLLIA